MLWHRLWMMRVLDLDAKLATEHYMKSVYVNRRTLHKQLNKTLPTEKNQTGLDVLGTDAEIDAHP